MRNRYPKIIFTIFFSIFLLFLFDFFFELKKNIFSSTPLKINIFTIKNGKGLETDQLLLQKSIEKLDHKVYTYELWESATEISYADVNIFLEMINSELIPKAQYNCFIPNPEWYRQKLNLLDDVDLILCKTKEAQRIFSELGKKTYFLGFTSLDCYQTNTFKNFRSFVHLPGGSIQKGSQAIYQAWLNNPSLPKITMVSFWPLFNLQQDNFQLIAEKLSGEDFHHVQNQSGIHLCPSETEGFGHYIMEGMSTGAVIVTTDAPPMNEFIKDIRCLVSPKSTSQTFLATNYHVDEKQLEEKIRALTQLSLNELEEMGKQNRILYEKIKETFEVNLARLLSGISHAKSQKASGNE